MSLFNASTMMGYVRTYRVVWINGRYGGGKTSLAFRIAHELVEKSGYRYIISNVKSVWNENPADVVLRAGKWVDAVIVLDEAGLFLENSFDAKKFLAFLRKLNIILIAPSVMPPSTKMRFLSIQRTMNLNLLGLPAWMYTTNLTYGNIRENGWFVWWHPSEIYGVYDTNGFPDDDAGVGEYVQKWITQAANKEGYEAKNTGTKKAVFSQFVQPLHGSSSENGHSVPASDAGDIVEELRRVASSLDDSTAETSSAVSILTKGAGRRGRRR